MSVRASVSLVILSVRQLTGEDVDLTSLTWSTAPPQASSLTYALEGGTTRNVLYPTDNNTPTIDWKWPSDGTRHGCQVRLGLRLLIAGTSYGCSVEQAHSKLWRKQEDPASIRRIRNVETAFCSSHAWKDFICCWVGKTADLQPQRAGGWTNSA